jgi:mRNA interferase MazF
MPEPSRGDVWRVDLNPIRGHEPVGVRPGLVVSVDPLNHTVSGVKSRILT